MAENSPARPLEMRDVFGQTLVQLGKEFPRMLVLDADLHTSSKAGYFKAAYPERFIQVGIAEQNLFGISAGLALEGFIPFPCTFAAFATRRALDQVAISICYPGLNVKIPGSYVGLPTSRAGTSHNCIEDIAVMRSLPNMRVADPGDNADLRAIMRTAIETDGPVYFRVTRYTFPDLFGADHRFEWGKGEVLRSGKDVTLFGTGMMTAFCMNAAGLLEKEGIDAEVVHLASIKPIDRELIASLGRQDRLRRVRRKRLDHRRVRVGGRRGVGRDRPGPAGPDWGPRPLREQRGHRRPVPHPRDAPRRYRQSGSSRAGAKDQADGMTSGQKHSSDQVADLSAAEAIRLFSDYLRVTGVAHTGPEPQGDPRLVGKRLGLLNGSSWITLWANYFGRMYLPGVHLVNAGNEAVQINFMEAHSAGSAFPARSEPIRFQAICHRPCGAGPCGRGPDHLLHHEPCLSPGPGSALSLMGFPSIRSTVP